MNKYVKVILYLISFSVIIILGVIGYKSLTKSYTPDEVNIENKENNLKKARDFEVLDNNGEKVKLSDFLGKPVVVNFWATWCTPCKSELPEFDENYKKYSEKIEFLMVNLTDGYSETVENTKEFIKENKYEFPVYFDTEYSASTTYNLYSIPQTLFIDKEGNILKSYKGMINKKNLDKYIKELVGE